MTASLSPTESPSADGLNLSTVKKSTDACSLNPKEAITCVSSANVSSASLTVISTSSILK